MPLVLKKECEGVKAIEEGAKVPPDSLMAAQLKLSIVVEKEDRAWTPEGRAHASKGCVMWHVHADIRSTAALHRAD